MSDSHTATYNKSMHDPTDSKAALYENIQLLNDLLFEIIEKQEGSAFIEIVKEIDKAAKSYYKGQKEIIETLENRIKALPDRTLLTLTRTFSDLLIFSDIAEQYHRIRRKRWYQARGRPPQPGSLDAVLPEMMRRGISKEALHQSISELQIDLVLTAHPTEVTRRTLLQKYLKISKNLECLDHLDLLPEDYSNIIEALRSEITNIWLTNEIRVKKPTVIDEAKWGFAVVEESLWKAIPQFYRDLDKILLKLTGKDLPLDAVPIKFSSWVGGDRDGNPNVTAKVTGEVIFLARKKALDLYWRDLDALTAELSLNQASPELIALVGETEEPYRALLRKVKEKLMNTRYWIENQSSGKYSEINSRDCYQNTEELLAPLMVCYRSLQEIGAPAIAKGALLDTIRRLHCFSLALLPIDIRQDANKHNDLMDAITEHLKIGSYKQWSEKERQDFLVKCLRLPLGLENLDLGLSPELNEYLETFRILGALPRDSLGVYIISMASQPSDLLLVLVLQREMKIAQPLKIVPLFETLEDLNQAPNCMASLFKIEQYRIFCQGRQEIMIGYSDSAKDAGFLAASWAQYQAKEALVKIGKEKEISIVFFHGRGGSAGRGGGPTHLAIRAEPPHTIKGKIRVTQQGEIIRYRFGIQKIAERSLAIYTTATLESSLFPGSSPKSAWRQLMNKMGETSLKNYRDIIKSPHFSPYFMTATPLLELDHIAIASRPGRRQGRNDFQNLRAIPWIFAWTQNRFLMPAWLGVGEALNQGLKESSLKFLQEMHKTWTYFSSTLSMVEMVLAKVDLKIAREYEKRLTPQTLCNLGDDLQEDFKNTKDIVLNVLQEKTLLETNSILQRSIAVRNPHLLPLHFLQIELLNRIRMKTAPNEDLQRALLVSIVGISAGMHNTG